MTHAEEEVTALGIMRYLDMGCPNIKSNFLSHLTALPNELIKKTRTYRIRRMFAANKPYESELITLKTLYDIVISDGITNKQLTTIKSMQDTLAKRK